jgi:hypothetical protein
MDTFRKTILKNTSKGGLIGALVGTLASTQAHRENDNLSKKTLKTGLFAGIGYIVGSLFEKWIDKNKTR